jgi:hypothetical protein
MLGLLAACASGGASVVKEDGKRPAAVDDDLLVPESYRAGPTVEAKRAKAVHKDEPDRPATDSELAAVKVLMDRAEKIRGLTFLRPVPVRIQQKSAVLAYVKSKLDHASAEQVRIRLVALGMIKPDEAIEQKAVEQLANDLLGYYDSTGKYLAIAERASYALTYHMNAMQTIEDRSVMLHELVHALQDQHFDLEHEAARQRTTDEQTAFMALVEGDATLAMLDFELRRFGVVMRSLIDDSGFFEQVMTGLPPTIGAAALGPKAVQSPVVFRYRGGALFAARLVVEGGYPSVDAAFRRQPRSTSEILRPEL